MVKRLKPEHKTEVAVRSGAAEYLTFVASAGNGSSALEMRYEDENIWLTQKMMAELYAVEIPTINYHLKKIFRDSELLPEATIRKFLIVQTEGNRQVERHVDHYALQMIIAIGFKVNSERAVQFRKWVNRIAKDYTIQGWAMDKDRLMHGGSVLTRDYFDRLLEEIREIRLSERKFYQKIADIYSMSLDYDPNAHSTRQFFAMVQNKLHWAIHGQTAAEVVYHRADATKEHMGLTSWKHSPHGKIAKSDVGIAKNYLSGEELQALGLIVSAYLDFAELMARRHIPMTMRDWAEQLDLVLRANRFDILNNPGKISAEIAQRHAESEFEKYRIVQDRLFVSDFDRFLALERQAKDTE